MKVVHKGRGGYIEYEGKKYLIEHIQEGVFCIHFPSGNKHNKLKQHLEALIEFAEAKEPKWRVENKSKKSCI